MAPYDIAALHPELLDFLSYIRKTLQCTYLCRGHQPVRPSHTLTWECNRFIYSLGQMEGKQIDLIIGVNKVPPPPSWKGGGKFIKCVEEENQVVKRREYPGCGEENNVVKRERGSNIIFPIY